MRFPILAAAFVIAACGGSNATTQPPPAPAGLAATGGAGQITLTWGAVPGATSYNVLRGDAAGTEAQVATSATNSFADSGLAAAKTYFYVVQAVNAAGKSGNSNEASAATLGIPAVPANLQAAAFSTHVTLTWTASPSAASYEVRRAPGGTTSFALAGSPAANTFDDTGLTANTGYVYEVRAVNAVGSSADTAPLNVTTAPPAPTSVAATAAKGKVSLTWDAMTGATGYSVLRSTTSGAGYVSLATPSTNGYVDATAANGTTYFYLVRSVSAAGTSDDSAQVSAMPFRALCVADQATNVVSVFNAEVDGDAAPLRKFGSQTGMVSPSSVAYDAVHGEYLVVNGVAGTVTAYSRTSSGNVAPVRVLSGLRTPSAIAYNRSTDEIIVAEGAAINTYDRAQTSAASPKTTLRTPATSVIQGVVLSGLLHGNRMFVLDQKHIYVYSQSDVNSTAPAGTINASGTFASIAYDSTSSQDQVLASTTSSTLLAFPADGTTSSPTRTLSGASTQLLFSGAVATDETQGTLFVYDPILGELLSFSLTTFNSATGTRNIAPSRALGGAATLLTTNGVRALAADEANSEVAVISQDARLLIFAESSSGNSPPARSISAIATGIDTPGGLAVDGTNSELILANRGQSASITVYDLSANGPAVTPKRRIEGPNNTGFASNVGVLDVALDPTHNELLVATGVNGIPIFSRTADGDVAPLRTITGPTANLTSVENTGYDPVSDAIVVNDNSEVRTFARAGTGDEPALTTITGASTGLSFVNALFVDVAHGEYVTLDSTANLASFFGRTATGNVAPSRQMQLTGANQSLVDGEEFFVARNNEVSVYPRTATGTPAQVRHIKGPSTGLFAASAMAICN